MSNKLKKHPPIGPTATVSPSSTKAPEPRVIPVKGKQQFLLAQAQQELNEAQAELQAAQAKFTGKQEKLNSIAQMVIAASDLEGEWRIMPGGVGIIEVFPPPSHKDLPAAEQSNAVKLSTAPPDKDGKLPEGVELLKPGPPPDTKEVEVNQPSGQKGRLALMDKATSKTYTGEKEAQPAIDRAAN